LCSNCFRHFLLRLYEYQHTSVWRFGRPLGSGGTRGTGIDLTAGRRFGNASGVRLAVDGYGHGRRESQMADEFRLLRGGLCREPLPVDEAVAVFGIHGEVADLARREVLEEMAALGRRHVEVGESSLDD